MCLPEPSVTLWPPRRLTFAAETSQPLGLVGCLISAIWKKMGLGLYLNTLYVWRKGRKKKDCLVKTERTVQGVGVQFMFTGNFGTASILVLPVCCSRAAVKVI